MIFPVSVVLALTQARRLGTLKDRIIMPWWCVVAFAALAFPILYGALSYEFERIHGRGVLAAVMLMMAWTAPHVAALSGLAVAVEVESERSEPAIVEVPDDQAAQGAPVAPAIPPGLIQCRPGTALDSLQTDWQLGQNGLPLYGHQRHRYVTELRRRRLPA